MTALGKIIGGGFPIGAVAGHAEIMEVFEAKESRPKLPHGGTYNANPVSMACGKVAMQMLTKDAFQKLNNLGQAFRDGIQDVFRLMNLDAHTQGQFSVFGLSINDKSMQDQSLRGQIYESTGLHYYMLKNGYWLTPGLTGVCSTIMDHSDVDPFCQTLLEGIKILRS